MTKKYENFFQDFLKPKARKAPTKTITKKNYKIRKTLEEDQMKEPTVEERRIKEPKKIDQVMTPDWAKLAMSARVRQPNSQKYYIFL